MMIDDVMYGMIPSANTAALVRAPPENRSRKPSAPFGACFFKSLIVLKSTYGAGMCDPSRNKKMMPIVNRIFFRRSGTWNMFRRRGARTWEKVRRLWP